MVQPLPIHTSALLLSSPLPCPPKVRYSIVRDQSGDWRFFTIDASSGAVVTQANLDREQKATYLIEVQSQDGTESARPGQQGQPNTGRHTHTQALFPCGHFEWFSRSDFLNTYEVKQPESRLSQITSRWFQKCESDFSQK